MKVLHVTLGNPHTHEGGLNRYCLDLARTQRLMGMKVAIIFPGKYTNKKIVKIKKVDSGLFKINNSLPVPITYGIDEPTRYFCKTEIRIYKTWLEKFKLDVIHVHSFMGIHKEFFEAAKELGIRLIFTTHDYFPICFKVNLYNDMHEICKSFEVKKCAACNFGNGLSKNIQRLMQSDLYPLLKQLNLSSFLKKKRSVTSITEQKKDIVINDTILNGYEQLHIYYSELMQLFDVIHCNSKIAMKYYKDAFPELVYQLVPITHSGIQKYKHERNQSKLRMSYFGGMSEHKGYSQLMELIEKLPQDNSWELNLYGGEFSEEYPINVHPIGYFSKEDEEHVWENTDVYLFISQWPETFGFGVLEALAKKIPVVCSDIVGASCLLESISERCVYKHNDINELFEKVMYLIDQKNYRKVQNSIENLEIKISMREHTKNITSIIYGGDK